MDFRYGIEIPEPQALALIEHEWHSRDRGPFPLSIDGKTFSVAFGLLKSMAVARHSQRILLPHRDGDSPPCLTGSAGKQSRHVEFERILVQDTRDF